MTLAPYKDIADPGEVLVCMYELLRVRMQLQPQALRPRLCLRQGILCIGAALAADHKIVGVTVSYTQLDVYKRKFIDSANGN